MPRSRLRESVWNRAANGRDHCSCNLCGGIVHPTDAWDVSHVGAPAALGGKTVGVAHRRCNREHNHRFVTPAVAKAKRVRRKWIGAHRSEKPLPGGRWSRVSKTLWNGVVERKTQGEKLAETLERRRIGSE